jgi:hypothetical protein
VSDFFTPPPPPEPVRNEPQPPWLGPPANELGVPVPIRLALAQTADVAVALLDVAAYSSGLEFRVAVRLRELDEPSDPFGLHRRGRGDLSDDVLRFGFEYADGRRVTNLGPFPGLERQDGPVLIHRGGGGGGRSWSFGYWLWPLPPAGPLTVAVEWPGRGIELTTFPLDGAALLEAAARSVRLWPGDEPADDSTILIRGV